MLIVLFSIITKPISHLYTNDKIKSCYNHKRRARKEKKQESIIKILQSMSALGGLCKHQNNPTCTISVSLKCSSWTLYKKYTEEEKHQNRMQTNPDLHSDIYITF